MDTIRSAHIVVGVRLNEPAAVVLEAAMFAAQFEAELVCAWVAVVRYEPVQLTERSMLTEPEEPSEDDEPSAPEPVEGKFDPRLEARLASILDGTGVGWSTRTLVGDPAEALGRLANSVDAAMIVIGTRRAGVLGTIRELFEGSVAAHLAHRQHRPVVVIPLDPVPIETTLPGASAADPDV